MVKMLLEWRAKEGKNTRRFIQNSSWEMLNGPSNIGAGPGWIFHTHKALGVLFEI